MSDSILKEVNGTLVTNTDIRPPNDWTNDYEDMGGDMLWGEYGDVAEICKSYGFDGIVKPLFAMQSYTGEAISIFEVNEKHYIYNAIEGSLYQINDPTDLQTIVNIIDDDSKGLTHLEIEPL
ncbi:hypothetical protein FLONG3_7650 [Fusarium longipes]|uniref:Uncharacterized protein n=1 Tax=Fusarium longipes TaxID=694270 RepID=A0A395SBV3_9HYPO|nr:hypothetical protein FLONG3_7650 [Fusarium longipes]